jgi:hypothetical protein
MHFGADRSKGAVVRMMTLVDLLRRRGLSNRRAQRKSETERGRPHRRTITQAAKLHRSAPAPAGLRHRCTSICLTDASVTAVARRLPIGIYGESLRGSLQNA